jgi:hypothetical protein
MKTASSTGGGGSVMPSVARVMTSAASAAVVAVTATAADLLLGQCTTRSVQPSPTASRARSLSLADSRSTRTPGGSRVASSRTLLRSLVFAWGWWPATKAVSASASITSRGESESSTVRTTGSNASGAVPGAPSSNGNCRGVRTR